MRRRIISYELLTQTVKSKWVSSLFFRRVKESQPATQLEGRRQSDRSTPDELADARALPTNEAPLHQQRHGQRPSFDRAPLRRNHFRPARAKRTSYRLVVVQEIRYNSVRLKGPPAGLTKYLHDGRFSAANTSSQTESHNVKPLAIQLITNFTIDIARTNNSLT